VGPREYYEWTIGKLSKRHAPRWVEEGFASYLAGEAAILEDLRQDITANDIAMSTQAMESALEREKDRQETRQAYYNAYRMVEKIVDDRVWRRWRLCWRWARTAMSGRRRRPPSARVRRCGRSRSRVGDEPGVA
jgi:hypothetical protein